MTRPDPDFWQGTRVVVTGGAGFLGRSVVTELDELGRATVSVPSSADLRPARSRPPRAAPSTSADVVIHLAARVGGIGFNLRNPAPLVYDNLMMGINVFEQSRLAGRGPRSLPPARSAATPSSRPLPFSEDDIWDGYPEESNAPYGLAKRMLIVLSDAYRRQYGFNSCVPVIANLYGPHDNFDLEDSHVIAAMIRKFVDAVEDGASAKSCCGAPASRAASSYTSTTRRARCS